MIVPLLFLLLMMAVPAHGQGTGVVRGRVSSEVTGAPLSLAVVEALGTGRPLAAPTDSAGAYLLRAVPAGRRILRAHQLGYAPIEMEVLVRAGGELVLDISLAQQPVALEPVKVQIGAARGAADTLSVTAPDLALAGARALESTPGLAELGLGESGGGVPGQEPVDPSDVLYVRGAAADLKLVLLDGAPVYAPFHLGGLIPPFEPGVLGSARLYLGGAPSRYDGGLSYVMDMRTRTGREEFHTSGALDLLSARAQVEGAVGSSARFLVGGRGIHKGGRSLLLGDSPHYEYADGLMRLDADLGEGTISLMGFRNAEGVQLDTLADGESMASWANSAASLRYLGRIAGADAELTAAFGAFDAHLPLDGRRPVLAEADAHRVRLAADLAQDAAPFLLRYGASYDRTLLRYRVRPRFGSPDSVRSDRAVGDAAGAYVDASWQPMSRLRLRGGLRADVFSLDPAPRLAPRLTATWLLTDRAALTLAAGRYHQYVRPPEQVHPSPDGASVDSLALSAALSVARGTHFSLGLDQDVGEGVRLGLEGFFKRFDGLPAARGDAANASGVDVWVRRGGGRVTGWLGYSLAWVWSVQDSVPASANFVGRQLLSSGLSGPLGRHGQFDVRVAYGAGLPYTAVYPQDVAVGSPRAEVGGGLASDNNAPPLVASPPDRPYLRIDVDISRTWTPQWNGVTFHLTPYLRVLNALDRRDAIFYRYDADPDTGPRAVAPLPLLPVLGMEWRF